jgi:hypothetical protein
MFGCVGVKHKKYCILNKQYSKEEYEVLMPKVAEHMKNTGEWGQFFPVIHSLYSYNETVAQDYFPLSRDEVLRNGWRWKEKDQKEYQSSLYNMEDNVLDTPDAIVHEILACIKCGKNYKILEKELQAYKSVGLPLSRQCSECRFQERMTLRNPRRLWQRSCQKCGSKIQTTYAPERPETVYCEKCYLEAVQ